MRRWLFVMVAVFAGWQVYADAREGKHRLVQLAYEDGKFETVEMIEVKLPLPKNRDGLARGDWRVTLKGKEGKEVFQTFIADPRLVRAHLEPPGEEPVKKTFRQKGRVYFSLRLPPEGGTLVFESRELVEGKMRWRELGHCELPPPGDRP